MRMRSLRFVATALATSALVASAPAWAGGAPALGTRSSLTDTTDQLALTMRRGHSAEALRDVLQSEAARLGVAVTGLRQSGDVAVVKLERRLPNAQVDGLADAVRRAAPRRRCARQPPTVG